MLSRTFKPAMPLPAIFVTMAFLVSHNAVIAQQESLLEEIVVTAQKREQSIQDIPIAVTALSGGQLVEYGITDMFDLQQNAPSLIVERSQTATTAYFSIRGVGTSGQNFGLEPSVGLYVDGVYRSRQSAMINELVDIERVEVLRGPQGTLFGRNASAGAVLLNTVAPSHHAGGFFEFTYGNLDLFSVNGAFGGSLVDDVLAFRVTGFTTHRDGFVDLLAGEKDVINDRDRQGGRAQLLYTPTDELSVRVIVDYSESDEICCAAATFRNNFFAFNGQPGSDALLTSLGIPLAGEDRFYDDVVNVDRLPVSMNDDRGVSAELNWDLGPGTVTAITAFRRFDTYDEVDGDFDAGDIAYRTNRAEADTFSQEIRFANKGGRLNYLAGAYYFSQDLDSRTTTALGSDFDAFLINGEPQLAAVVNGLNNLSLATGGLIPRVARAAIPGSSARELMLQDHEAWALFGQFDFQLTEQLQLSAGLRYTDEKKELLGTFEQDNFGPPPDFLAIGANLQLVAAGLAAPDIAVLSPLFAPGWGFYLESLFAPRPDVDENLKDDQITWNARLSWFPNEDMMLYAGYATGFKSGGTNTDRIPPVFSQLFDAEESNSFEVGVKVAFPTQNLRAHLALHYTTIEDFQSIAFTGAGFNLQNAGELEARGGELEITWAPTPTLIFTGAYVYNEAEYEEFERANCWLATPFLTGRPDPGQRNPGDSFCDRTGDRVSANPENTVILSATQSYSINDSVSGYIHADYNYRSSIVTDVNVDPLKIQDGFGLLNARAGLVLRAIDLDIALWARNLLDEDYHGAVFDVPLQDGKLSGYNREPRTFGVTVRKQF